MEIVGFPNYLIYPDGRVWSNYSEGRFLKHGKNKVSGYFYVHLSCNNKRKTLTIHRLIAEYYIPNPNDYPCVDHKNRIRTDNRIENLGWATHHMNSQNVSKNRANTSGHSLIIYNKQKDIWFCQKKYRNKKYVRYFKSKIDCICYKYIILLKLRVLKNT